MDGHILDNKDELMIQHVEREEVLGTKEDVPDGYFRRPMFLGTILAVGLGMFSVRCIRADSVCGINPIQGTASYSLPAAVLGVINNDIGPNANYVWVGLVNTLMLGVGYTIIGRLSDICGRRYFIIGGNLLGVIGCIIAATAQSIPTLIGGNVLTGLASAAQTSTPAVLGELIPLKHRFAVTGVMYFVWVLPGGFGAAISYGFVLHTAAGWRNVYWLLLATNAAATICWTIFYHPPTFVMKNNRTRIQMLKDFDHGGFVLFTGGLIVFLMGLSWGGSVYPWNSVHVIATLVIGACTLIAFVLYECFMPLVDPLIPMHLFKNWGMSALTSVSQPTTCAHWLMCSAFSHRLDCQLPRPWTGRNGILRYGHYLATDGLWHLHLGSAIRVNTRIRPYCGGHSWYCQLRTQPLHYPHKIADNLFCNCGYTPGRCLRVSDSG